MSYDAWKTNVPSDDDPRYLDNKDLEEEEERPMAWSISMTVNADGQVAITATATDRFGGCSYYVASKHGGDLEGLTPREACARVRGRLKVRDEWQALAPYLREAAARLVMCLPPPEDFDADGSPIDTERSKTE